MSGQRVSNVTYLRCVICLAAFTAEPDLSSEEQSCCPGCRPIQWATQQLVRALAEGRR